MALTAAELDALTRKPTVVTSDAGSVTQRSADDLIKLNNYQAAQLANQKGKPAVKIFKIVPPGSV